MPVSSIIVRRAVVRIGAVAVLVATMAVPNVLLGAADAHAATGGTALTAPVLSAEPSTASTVATRIGNPCNTGTWASPATRTSP